MEYSIQSYIKVGETFIPIEKCVDVPLDPDYVEGGIEWKVGKKEVLSLQQYDLVDQLWAYIVHGMAQVGRNEEFETYFPDQPLLLRFRRVSSDQVEVTIGKTQTNLESDVFFQSLTDGARQFVTEMKRLLPQHGSTWNELLTTLSNIVK